MLACYTRHQPLLTLHVQSEVGCSPPCLIVAHHLVHSTVTPGSAGDGDGADRGGYPSTTGDDLAISGPGEVGRSWSSFKPKGVSEVFPFQQSGGSVWEEAVNRRVCGEKLPYSWHVRNVCSISSVYSGGHCIPNNVHITEMVAGGSVCAIKSVSSVFSMEHETV